MDKNKYGLLSQIKYPSGLRKLSVEQHLCRAGHGGGCPQDGNGAMSGGLAFEGLNNVSSTPNDLLIVLNDNDMSIDHAVGGMEKYLLNLDTNETYNRLRFKASQWLHSKGYLNDDRRKGIIRLNNALKSAISRISLRA